MGITIVWDNSDHTVMRMTFTSPWNWDDLETILTEVHAMLDTVNHRVDVIVDMKNSGAIPEGAFWRFHKLTQTKHRNRGRVILVGGNTFIRTMTDTVRRLANDLFDADMFVLAPTVEDARAVLFKKRLEMANSF